MWQLLAGLWVGRGEGEYPDVASFAYVERTEITLATDWGMLRVLQQTWQEEPGGKRGKPLHLEAGLIIPQADGRLLYNCAQDGGRTEVMVATPVTREGSLILAWQTIAHCNDSRLVKVGRDWTVSGERFAYQAYLSTKRTPEYRKHLDAMLIRESPNRSDITK